MMDTMLRKRLRMGLLSCGGAIAALMSLTMLVPAAMAQTTTPTPASNDPESTSNPFAEDAQIGDMLDLIHRANFSNSRSGVEIRDDRRNNIQSAAEQFRQQQRERLLQDSQAQPQPETPALIVPPTP